MVLQQLEPLRIQITEFLQITLVDSGIIFIDLWSMIHLIFGLIVMFFLIKVKVKRPYILLFALLLVYEVLEFALVISAPAFINPESLRDFVWDIVFGMLGGFIYIKINDKTKRRSK